jgi:type II secretory pathway pseudopilin PulG
VTPRRCRTGARAPFGRARRATTLVETLVVVLIVVALLAIVYKLFLSGLIRGEEMVEEMNLLAGIRPLLENMSRDVATAHVILPPPPDSSDGFAATLTVARYAGDDATGRVAENSHNPVYPYFDSAAPTTVKLSALRVRYVFDRARGTLSRIEERGVLTGQVGDREMSRVAQYSFAASGPTSPRPLPPATGVESFELEYMRYDDKGKPTLITRPEDVHLGACVGVRIVALHATGPYARKPGEAATRRQPRLEMATKFWTARRLSDAVYPEYVSSADEDLEY